MYKLGEAAAPICSLHKGVAFTGGGYPEGAGTPLPQQVSTRAYPHGEPSTAIAVSRRVTLGPHVKRHPLGITGVRAANTMFTAESTG